MRFGYCTGFAAGMTGPIDYKTLDVIQSAGYDYVEFPLMQLAALAFVGAQDSFPLLSDAKSRMIDTITYHMFEDFHFSEAGIEVICEVEQEGYVMTGMELLMPSKEGECNFSLEFCMRKK